MYGIEYSVVTLVCVALLFGALVRSLGGRIKLPYSVTMLLVGAVVAVVLQNLGAYGLLQTAWQLPADGMLISAELVIFVFLPALVFQSAFSLDAHVFRAQILPITWLAIPGFIFTTIITALLGVAVTSGSWAWSLPVSLVFAALISATDPVAVVSIMKELGVSKKLATLVEGESLLNDGAAIVGFTILLAALVSGQSSVGYGHAVSEFFRVSAGGIGLGVVLGYVVSNWIGRTFNDAAVEITLTLVVGYIAMIIAEGVLHVSGVMAIVTAGLWMSSVGRAKFSPVIHSFLFRFWDIIAYMANTLIFFLVGAVVAILAPKASMSDLYTVFGLYAVALVVRSLTVILSKPILDATNHKITAKESMLVSWGGLRGAVSLALALVVSQSSGIDEAIRTQVLLAAVGVVLLSLVINGSTTAILLNALGLDRPCLAKQLSETAIAGNITRTLDLNLSEMSAASDLQSVQWSVFHEQLLRKRHHLRRQLKEVQRDVESKSLAERKGLFWGQALEIERQAYWSQFSLGSISGAALQILNHQVDHHQDMINQGEVTPPKHRIPENNVWMKFFKRTMNRFGIGVSDRMDRNYHLLRGQAIAARHVLSQLEQIELVDENTFANIRRTYMSYCYVAIKNLENMRNRFPAIVTSIENKLAQRLILNAEKKELVTAAHNGLLDHETFEKRVQEVDAKIKQLLVQPSSMELPDVADLLREVPILSNLSEELIEQIADLGRETTVPMGAEIYEEGELANGMSIILKGAAEIYRGTGVKAQRINVVGVGNVIGEIATLTGARRNATVRAATPLTFLTISRKSVISLNKKYPTFEAQLWKTLAEKSLLNFKRQHRGLAYLDDSEILDWAGEPVVIKLENEASLDIPDKIYWVALLHGKISYQGAVMSMPGLYRVSPQNSIEVLRAGYAVFLTEVDGSSRKAKSGRKINKAA
jgi:NhaP-type Na+/H+ or K+/H+ antiporter